MSQPTDRLTLLATFARIAERGSISAAARDLGITQATASRHLQDLEARLGTPLARRTTHSLALTGEGEAVLAEARALLAGWEALVERHAQDEIRGRLSVVAPVALGQTVLTDIAVELARTHPALRIDWRLEDAPVRLAELGSDCWIRVGPVPDDTLVVRSLGQVERLLVAAPDLSGPLQHPKAAETLPLLALDPFEGGRIALMNGAQRQEIAPPVTFSTNNIAALHRVALSGAGIAVLPYWYVADDLQAGRLIDLLPDWRAAELTVNVAFPPGAQRLRRLAVFLDAVEAGLPKTPGISAPG
ncbi:LysR family transcriptional regulator [Pontivivens ytuae]|uniref:LysR family transcriptional regulator n=1 Tax=Pontivivens ytuae TaxID=2789856 RepID=A0A7S9QCD0_9RHOB|nr:LysR family transcriptional regulator [Pontivivens ytuae]QPH53783.1 LysR family transcriptional regulator [Pontivivens ytuae]